MNKEQDEKSYHEININWFPGHMAKTRRQIEEDLKLVDVVVELLDARIPISSQNPDIKRIIKSKKRIVVLNKSDLAEDSENKKWESYFEKQGIPCSVVDSNSGLGIEKCIKKIEKTMEEETNAFNQKGRIGRKIKVMIIGIPNVGKSSFINRIANKTSAEVGNKPGVTKNKQWIRINEKIELLDTPGILWPKFESNEVALNLAFTGTIKEDILDRVEISYNLIKYLLENNVDEVCTRYKIEKEKVQEILNQEQPENENIYEIMQLIGKNRGAIVSGGKIDDEKTAKIILDDFRTLKFGKITLEKCTEL